MKKCIDLLKKQPLLTVFVAAILAVVGIKAVTAEGFFSIGIHRCVLSAAMCFMLYLIVGEKTFDKCGETTGYAIKMLLPMLIISLASLGMNVFGHIYTNDAVRSDCAIRVIVLLFAMLAVGFYEELFYRAIMNDGIVYQFRDKKWVFAFSAVFGSLFFGAVHVIGSDISTPLLLAQAVLKTLTGALSGLCYLIIYWKTRNIYACAIMHGLYDFISMMGNQIFISDEEVAVYVQDGEAGIGAVVVYIADIIFTFIILLILRKKVYKTIDFEEMRKNW